MTEPSDVRLMDRDGQIGVPVDLLSLLPLELNVERVSGDAAPDNFIGPGWCLDERELRVAFDSDLDRRDTWQGKRYVGKSKL